MDALFTSQQVRQHAETLRADSALTPEQCATIADMLDDLAWRIEDDELWEPRIPDGMVEVSPGLAVGEDAELVVTWDSRPLCWRCGQHFDLPPDGKGIVTMAGADVITITPIGQMCERCSSEILEKLNH